MTLFDHSVTDLAFKAYIKVFNSVVNGSHLSPGDFLFSPCEFTSALRDVRMDCDFIKQRRALQKGISYGKFAGIMAFRLGQRCVAYPGSRLVNNSLAFHIPFDTAIAFGLNIIGVSPYSIPPKIVREIKYDLAKTRTNQEALGICYDILSRAKFEPNA